MEYLNKLMLKKIGLSGIEIPFDISWQNECPTYLRKFIGDQQIDFIYKQVTVEETSFCSVSSLPNYSKNDSLCGSPLELELADESFNDELMACNSLAKFQLWHKSEAEHGSMSRKDSILLVNNFLSKRSNKTDYQWIWFVVDSSEHLLFGSRILNRWWFNARIKPMSPMLYNEINLKVLQENFIKENKLDYNDVTVTVSVEYDLQSSGIECYDEEDLSTSQPMKLQAYWNELSLTIPLLSGKTTLHQELLVGSDGKAKQLWKEICLVQDLYDLIKSNQNVSSDMLNKIIMPSSCDSVLYEAIEDKLQDMLHQDSEYDIEQVTKDNLSFMRSVAKGRPILSFCDEIWVILKDVSCYSQLVKCFNIIFSTIAHGKINIEVQNNANTRLESLVHDVYHQRAAIPYLSGLQPLELLLEAGVEKLNQDYIYFFETSKLYHSKLPFYDV